MDSNGSAVGSFKMNFFAVALGAALLATVPASAQYGAKPQQPQQQQQSGQTAQQGTKQGQTAAPATPPVKKEDEDAATGFFAMSENPPAPMLAAGEDFLTKFPDSRFRDAVYSKLVAVYYDAGQQEKVVDTGNRALRENPNNADVLSFMSWYLGRRHHPNALDADQELLLIAKYAHHALELIPTLPKPENVTDESFDKVKNQKMGMCHSGLAYFFFWQNKTPEMVSEFAQSTVLDPTPDPMDFYFLGEGDAKMKKFADAAAAYDRCSQSQWAWQDKCKAKFAQAQSLAAAQAPAAATPAGAAPAPATSSPVPASPAPADAPKPKPPRA